MQRFVSIMMTYWIMFINLNVVVLCWPPVALLGPTAAEDKLVGKVGGSKAQQLPKLASNADLSAIRCLGVTAQLLKPL